MDFSPNALFKEYVWPYISPPRTISSLEGDKDFSPFKFFDSTSLDSTPIQFDDLNGRISLEEHFGMLPYSPSESISPITVGRPSSTSIDWLDSPWTVGGFTPCNTSGQQSSDIPKVIAFQTPNPSLHLSGPLNVMLEVDLEPLKSKTSWINDMIIYNHLTKISANNDEVSVIHPDYPIYIQRGEIVENVQCSENWQTTLLPLNQGNKHWLLVVFDRYRKRILICDSLKNNKLSEPEMDAICKLWFKLPGNQTDNPKIVSPRRCYQTDSYNCGVFVCLYAERLINGQSLMFPTSLVDDFRGHLYKLLLQMIKPKESNGLKRKVDGEVNLSESCFCSLNKRNKKTENESNGLKRKVDGEVTSKRNKKTENESNGLKRKVDGEVTSKRNKKMENESNGLKRKVDGEVTSKRNKKTENESNGLKRKVDGEVTSKRNKKTENESNGLKRKVDGEVTSKRNKKTENESNGLKRKVDGEVASKRNKKTENEKQKTDDGRVQDKRLRTNNTEKEKQTDDECVQDKRSQKHNTTETKLVKSGRNSKVKQKGCVQEKRPRKYNTEKENRSNGCIECGLKQKLTNEKEKLGKDDNPIYKRLMAIRERIENKKKNEELFLIEPESCVRTIQRAVPDCIKQVPLVAGIKVDDFRQPLTCPLCGYVEPYDPRGKSSRKLQTHFKTHLFSYNLGNAMMMYQAWQLVQERLIANGDQDEETAAMFLAAWLQMCEKVSKLAHSHKHLYPKYL